MSLKAALTEARIPIAELARATRASRTALSLLINRNVWPAHNQAELRNQIKSFFRERGLPLAGVFANEKPRSVRAPRGRVVNPTTEETDTMITHCIKLTPKARAHFNLSADPFGECQEPADVYMSPDIRYVRETLWSTARHGGFVAIVGESGAGKTTIREELIERLRRDEQPVHVIQPYVLAMEESDTTGKTLRALHIAEAVMRTVAPLQSIRSSPEARFDQVHQALCNSSRAGMRHLILIEEAHCMPVATLKHLKRFLELKDGMKRLLGIVLLAQPELLKKLSTANASLREVTQRIEIVQLAPLAQVGDYLKHRFARAGTSLDAVIEPSAVDALRATLGDVYPQALHNLLARSMNTAATVGAPLVTKEMVREGGR